MQMKLASLNLGLPREVVWHGINVTTGIVKKPVEGRVVLRKLNLDGDRQADLTVHGGAEKAVYCYPLGHYEYWKKQLPDDDLPIGMFGENFTIDFSRNTGAPEDVIHIGDRFSVGSAEVVVTQPRLPCYKLGVRFQMDDMVKRFSRVAEPAFTLRYSARVRSVPETKCKKSVEIQTLSRFLKLRACTLRKDFPTMMCGC